MHKRTSIRTSIESTVGPDSHHGLLNFLVGNLSSSDFSKWPFDSFYFLHQTSSAVVARYKHFSLRRPHPTSKPCWPHGESERDIGVQFCFCIATKNWKTRSALGLKNFLRLTHFSIALLRGIGELSNEWSSTAFSLSHHEVSNYGSRFISLLYLTLSTTQMTRSECDVLQ